MHASDYLKFHLSRNARWFVMVCLVLLFSMPASSEATDADHMARVAEVGGTTATLILALYWLREANSRRIDDVREQKRLRIEESQRYAEQLRAANERLTGIVNKLIKMEEE